MIEMKGGIHMDHISEREKRNIENLRASLSDCTVLLNYKGGFPLSEPGKIAAYGNGVRYTQKGGTGSGEVNSRYFLTVEQGLEEAGFTITTKTWLDAYDSVRQAEKVRQSEERKRKAKEEHINMMALAMGAVYREPEYDLPLEGEGDTAVYVLTRNAGEGNDRTLTKGDYLLTDTEVRDICALDERYPTFVLVLNTCGAVDLSPVAHVSNILSLSQLGVETGAILADILLGKSVPSGRLASSWPFAKDLPAIGNFGQTDDTDYREGIYVGYRYYDVMKKELRYPFGYGLSYTSFERTVHDVHIEGPCIFFRVRVANTGEYPGKEVVQVYLSAPWGRLGKAPRSLAAFAKTRLLQKGEEEDLVLSFDMRDNTSYDEASASRILEKGRYLVSVNEEKAFVLDLPEDKTIEKDRHAFGAPALPDFIPYKREPEIPEDLPVYLLDLSGVETFVPVYDQDPKIPELLKTLSDEELAYLGIGAFDPKSRFGSVIGEASSHVAGAAGESTSMLKEKGIRAMVFADGPAGLRLSKDYYEDEKGVHGLGGGIPESILEGMPAPIRFFLSRKSRLKKGTVIKHQYTTAIPTATAIATSMATWTISIPLLLPSRNAIFVPILFIVFLLSLFISSCLASQEQLLLLSAIQATAPADKTS